MAERPAPLPPPAPPLPPARYGNRAKDAIVRFAQPFIFGARPASAQVTRPDDQHPRPGKPNLLSPSPLSSQFATHKTGIPIAALDISPQRTHAVLAGKDILKTIRISGTNCAEEFNLRSTIISYASTHSSTAGALPSRHRDQLAANDVKWSHGEYDTTIATAAANGRIVLYDIHRPGVELARLHEHNRQVHRLAFNPHAGSKLLSGSQDGTVRLWDLRALAGERSVMTLRSNRRFQGNVDAIRDVRWSPTDGVEFAIASDQGIIQRWDTRKDNAPSLRINAHEKACYSVDWHPDGKHLLSASSDNHVKVWDFKSSDRRQKPVAQFKAPQAVMNARWRPPCWSSETQEAGDWQSTQLVTGYNQDDPRVHLWDLRRPHIPFREFDRYNSPPTDLLWHSKNLLWTVGNEGMFTQTDIQFAPQTVHRRSLATAAWRPGGDFLAFAQRRTKRRSSGLADVSADFLDSSRDRGSSGEKPTPSRSLNDEHDEGFLSTSFRRRQSKSSSAKPTKSLGGTPPSRDDYRPILPLDEALHKKETFHTSQVGAYGNVTGAVASSHVFKYLAANYAWLRPVDELSQRPVVSKASFDAYINNNASVAEEVGQYRLAQTWRIYGAEANEVRAEHEEKIRKVELVEQARQDAAEKSHESIADVEQPEIEHKEEERAEKLRSHLFKGVVEKEAHKSVPELDSTSNMTTPLAKPLPDSPLSTLSPSAVNQAHYHNQIEPIMPLPPSILSSELALTRSREDNKEDSLAMSHLQEDDEKGDGSVSQRSKKQKERQITFPHPDIVEPHAHHEAGQLPDVLGERRPSARVIESRPDWRVLASPDYRDAEEQKRAALRDYRGQARPILTFETSQEQQAQFTRPIALDRHDSSESFPMFSASTDSSHRAKSLGGSYPSPDLNLGQSGTPEHYGLSAVTTRTDSPAVPDPYTVNYLRKEFYKHNPPVDFGMDGAGDERLPPESTPSYPKPLVLEDSIEDLDLEQLTLDRPDPPLRLSKDPINKPAKSSSSAVKETDKAGSKPLPHLNGGRSRLPSSESKMTKAVPSLNIMRAISKYMLGTVGDAQFATYSLLDVEEMYTYTAESISVQQREAVLMSYHQALLRHRAYVQATHLRKLCVPDYPAVFTYAQDNLHSMIWCHACQKPFENSVQGQLTCERCSTILAHCPICNARDLPADVASALGVELPAPGDKALWATCPGCGHGAHVGCMELWLSDIEMSEGNCPTDGCFHDCGPGRVREERIERQTESYLKRKKSHGARKDSWVVGESRAVVKARKVLKEEPAVSAGAGIGAVEAGSGGKRVRLVTPGEEGV